MAAGGLATVADAALLVAAHAGVAHRRDPRRGAAVLGAEGGLAIRRPALIGVRRPALIDVRRPAVIDVRRPAVIDIDRRDRRRAQVAGLAIATHVAAAGGVGLPAAMIVTVAHDPALVAAAAPPV